ncbi:MAG TPA: SpoIIIAH-like family protein [Candidatus Pullichristensenella excrementigallinarum]|uniref:SpoIIIAH-like family protein n=1 Tax=Candidatus Pullichristensenella excrementigallinarum TaxID=2840907 RepID=A0A9D1LBT5_9FIRM|nr:SpoIIIAH-like family protein [Candidatus Pullichristensenella excrementigallinarum]
MNKNALPEKTGRIRRWMLVLCSGILMAVMAAVALPELQRPPAVETAAQNPTQAPEEEDPLKQFRLEREQLRAMQLAQLNDIIYGEKTDEETRAMAQRQLLELTDWMEKEVTIEGVLRSRGFEDALATVHTDSVNVLVRCESITQQQTAVILDLVLAETGVSGGNVKLIPIN